VILILFSLNLFFSSYLFAQQTNTVDKGKNSDLNQIKKTEESLVIPESNSPTKESAKKGENRVQLVSTWDFVKMFIVLLGVVGFIYLIFFLLKRSTKRRFIENDLIEIVSSKDLSGGKALHILKVGGMFLLVGVSDSGINLITRIDDKETIDDLNLRISEFESNERVSFQSAFSDIFKLGRKRDTVSESLDFMKQQRERLNKLKR